MAYSIARIAAFIYAALAFAAAAPIVAAMLSDPSPPWRKVVSWSAISVFAPLIPYAGLRLGTWLARTDGGRAIAAWGTLAAVMVAGIIAIAIAFSVEPLAALAMLYVPPLQVVCFLAALGLIWMKDRA